MLLQMAEQSGQLNAEVTDAAVASLQRGAQAVGQGIAQAAAGAAPAAGAPGGAQRVSTGISVDSDVDKILSSALSELGLEGDSGPDRVVRETLTHGAPITMHRHLAREERAQNALPHAALALWDSAGEGHGGGAGGSHPAVGVSRERRAATAGGRRGVRRRAGRQSHQQRHVILATCCDVLHSRSGRRAGSRW